MTPAEWCIAIVGVIGSIVIIRELIIWECYQPTEEMRSEFCDSELSAAVKYAQYMLSQKGNNDASVSEEPIETVSA